MRSKLSWRLQGALVVLALFAGPAGAAVVYSDTLLAKGPEFVSSTELALSATGAYRVTATDLKWLDTPLSALSFGVFTTTAPIVTKVGAGTLEFFHTGQRTFLQVYARPGVGKSAGLIGLQIESLAVVPLPASVWLLLSSLTAAGFWSWLGRRASAAAARVTGARAPSESLAAAAA